MNNTGFHMVEIFLGGKNDPEIEDDGRAFWVTRLRQPTHAGAKLGRRRAGM